MMAFYCSGVIKFLIWVSSLDSLIVQGHKRLGQETFANTTNREKEKKKKALFWSVCAEKEETKGR